jgi:hypothetical protein
VPRPSELLAPVTQRAPIRVAGGLMDELAVLQRALAGD